MNSNGLLLASLVVVAIASSILAMSPWGSAGMYVVALGLLLTSLTRDGGRCDNGRRAPSKH